jgi:hypothetical protein
VYTALQTAQGIALGLPISDGSNWPTLSVDTIRHLLSGNTPTWSGALRGVSLAGNLNNLTVCRREQGSGTQSASNQYFFNYPCDLNSGVTPRQDTGGQLVSGLMVVENNSSGFVKTCLNSVEAGVNGFPQSGGIGVFSYNGNPGGSDTYKWIKIGGVQPSMKNAILGKYDFWYEAQIGWNATNATALELALANAIRSEIMLPARITAASANGVAALSVNGAAWDNGVNNTAFPSNFTATNPVMGSKHSAINGFSPAGSSPLSCRPLVNATDGAGLPDRQ